MYLVSPLTATSGDAQLIWTLVLLGVAMGTPLAPSATTILGSVPAARAGVGSAVNSVGQQLGGALAVAVLGSLANTTYGRHEHDCGAPAPRCARSECQRLADRCAGHRAATRRLVQCATHRRGSFGICRWHEQCADHCRYRCPGERGRRRHHLAASHSGDRARPANCTCRAHIWSVEHGRACIYFTVVVYSLGKASGQRPARYSRDADHVCVYVGVSTRTRRCARRGWRAPAPR